jgi:hypothetical protein
LLIHFLSQYSNRFITAFDLPLELATAAGGRLDQKQQASASVEKGKKPVVCVIAGDHPFYFDYHPELVDQVLSFHFL